MRKFTLTLAERILLRPVVANAQGNLETVRRAFAVLEAIDFTEGERELIPQVGIIDLDGLPDSPSEIHLEEAEYEWLVRFVDTYQGWQPRKPLFSMVEAIKGAEPVLARDRPGRVSLSLQDPVPQGSPSQRDPEGRDTRDGCRGKGKPGERTD